MSAGARKAIVIPVNDVVSPLGEPARDTWFLDAPLGQGMRRALETAGLEVHAADSLDEAEQKARDEPEGALVVLDSVAFSPQLLRDFLRAAGKTLGPTALRAALASSVASDRLSHVSGLEPIRLPSGDGTMAAWTAPLYFLRGAASLRDATPCLLPHKANVVRHPLPKGMSASGETVYGVSDSFFCNVSHWVHVLRVNMAAQVLPWGERWRVGFFILGIGWYLWRLLLAFPFTGGRLAQSFRIVHRGARVHHTAHIEGSVIAKGAVVGINAIIKYSYIGEGAHVEDGAQIVGSVVAPGAFVGRLSSVIASVLYPESFGAQRLMQFSVLGTRAIALTTSNFFDLNFDRNVRVAHRGAVVDSGDAILGVCVGPRARIGGGVWIASGREVPADAFLIKDPAEVGARIGNIGKAAAITRGGVLVPLEAPPKQRKDPEALP